MPLVNADAMLAASARLAAQAEELGRTQARLRGQAESMRWNSPAASAFDHALSAMLAGLHATRTQLGELAGALSQHAHTAQRRAQLLAEAAQEPTRIVGAVAKLL